MDTKKIDEYRDLLRIKASTFVPPKVKNLNLIVADNFPFYLKKRKAGLAFISLDNGIFPVIYNYINKEGTIYYNMDIAFIGFTKEEINDKFKEIICSDLLMEDSDIFYQILPALSIKKIDKVSTALDWLDKIKQGNLFDESNVLIDSKSKFNRRIMNLFGFDKDFKYIKSLESLSEKDLAKAVLNRDKFVRAQLKFRK